MKACVHGKSISHVTGGHFQGGKTCLYTHFGGAETLFSYIYLQVTDSVGGGAKPSKMFHLEGWAMSPGPLCRYVPEVYPYQFGIEAIRIHSRVLGALVITSD